MPFGETKPNCLGRTKGGGVQFIDENGGGTGVRLRKPPKGKPASDQCESPGDVWRNEANFLSG